MICVDPLLKYPNRPFGYPKWCHLFVSGGDEELESLHRFATTKLGLQRRWFQAEPKHLAHYDLTEGKRRLAIAQGAYPLTWAQVKVMLRERTKDTPIDPTCGHCLICKRPRPHYPPAINVICGHCLSELGIDLCRALARPEGQALPPAEQDTTITVGKRKAELWFPE